MTANWQLKWGDKITVKFAELYKKAECLWNAELPSYQHQPTRKRELLKLIENLNVDGLQIKQIKRKIKNIRSSYYKELYKIEKSQGAEDAVVYQPSMKWFEILDSFMRVRRTTVLPNSQNCPPSFVEFPEVVQDSSDPQNTQDVTVPVNTASKDNSVDSPKVGRLPKWDEDETFKFVELYKEAECLWNSEIPQYRHKASRIKAIFTIIEKMNMELTIQEVKSKIKNLRSTYSQELYKIEKSRKSEDLEQYVPMIRWFYVMDSFVHVRRVIGHVRRGETTLNQSLTTIPDDFEQDNWEVCYVDDSNKNIKQELSDDYLLSTFTQKETDPIADTPSICNNSPPASTDLPKITKIVSRSSIKSPRAKVATPARDNNESIEEGDPKDSENEYYVFGRHVATQLMKLSTVQFVLAQQEIQSVLTNCRLKSLKRKRNMSPCSNSSDNSDS